MISNADSVKIIIDGFPIENMLEFKLELGTYDYNWSFDAERLDRARTSNVQATIRASDGTVLEFNVQGKEQAGNTVYFYGPLRALFPGIFKDIDPLEWQVAYLEAMGRPSLDRFKVRRDDEYFTSELANTFRLGWEAGNKAGAVNERKLAKIAADGLKNPPKAKDNAVQESAKQVSALGEAFRRKKGK